MLTLRSQSFRRYRIHGRLPSAHSEEFLKAVTDRKFLPLTASEERTYGWTTVDNLLVTDFTTENITRGNWVALGLRIDKRRVNARLLRAHFELEVEARRKAANDQGERFRLGRDERREMREGLYQELLKQTSPSIDLVPVMIHTKRRTAHVLKLAKGANDLARVHFLDTFGLDLIPLTPWRQSQELLEGTPLSEALDEVLPTDFGAAPREVRTPGSPAARGVGMSSEPASRMGDTLERSTPEAPVADEEVGR